MTTEISTLTLIRFRAIKHCPHILQAPAHCATILTAGSEAVPGMKVIGVYLNGAPLKHRSMDDITVSVSPPLCLEGGRVELRCEVPEEPRKAPVTFRRNGASLFRHIGTS
jgi:hypothetical protein